MINSANRKKQKNLYRGGSRSFAGHVITEEQVNFENRSSKLI